ncbi:CobN/magnesium chelatase [mine drainage metagenome]|uniref:CobN/magnesium chelatase n=1 Tax=mine drainage metagenome TaxID=410659 RepID=T0ZP97_9ZZZZ
MAEEAARVMRSRVLNPKWIAAMMRHGYKGAFEMSATVDYLFGYDATASVGKDWMYEGVTAAYAGDDEVRAFFGEHNPWALKAIVERLYEAADRGMWSPSEEALSILEAAEEEAEGFEEDRT